MQLYYVLLAFNFIVKLHTYMWYYFFLFSCIHTVCISGLQYVWRFSVWYLGSRCLCELKVVTFLPWYSMLQLYLLALCKLSLLKTLYKSIYFVEMWWGFGRIEALFHLCKKNCNHFCWNKTVLFLLKQDYSYFYLNEKDRIFFVFNEVLVLLFIENGDKCFER